MTRNSKTIPRSPRFGRGRRARRSGLITLISLIVALGTVGACGGGGGGGGGGTGGPTQPTSNITFTPSGSGASGISLVRSSASTTTTLVLEVRATSVSAIYGVAFDLDYPEDILRFDGATEGDFLQGGSGLTQTSLQVVEQPSGNIVVGLSRLGGVGGVGGSGLLLTLRFTGIRNGNGGFGFDENQAFNSGGIALGGVSWSAGTVQVVL